ncbi:hypothetical protein NQ317_006651 [Molorchus minor]|uniref:Uncharacterized protein n=1 Tax=Molorchus minor TaxID=1323400 RepID=A0ABQ9IZH5_9CUCU|nr:hypothetical protein NQ317_006651 [Molorchus minor]
MLQLKASYLQTKASDIEIEQPPSLLPYEDEKIDKIGNILTRLLIVPWPNGISPLLYVETNPVPEEEQEVIENNLVSDDYENLTPVPSKRTRYYRKYPWKRQNSRYEPGNRFLCTPSKEDVYRLLVALHEARQGNRNRVVNFCNRKRPAYTIFTNIRFLGK